MGYHLVDPEDVDQHDDRPADVRSLTAPAGYEHGDATVGARVYELQPGQQTGLAYHSHDEQVELFYVLGGTLHVETPGGEYVVERDQALVIDPESPQRAHNPGDADGPVRLLAVGAPSADDARPYEPDPDE